MTDVAETEPDYKSYLDKAPTILQERFAGWLQGDEVGYNPAGAKTKQAAFEEGVRLAVALRMLFQASDFNRAENARVKAENEAKREASAAAAANAPDPEPVAAPAPAKAAKAAKKAAPAKAARPGTPESKETVAPAAPVTRAPARRAPARKATAGAAPTAAPF